MRRLHELLCGFAVVVCCLSVAAAADSGTKGERYRLVLTSGAVYEVTGPVEHKGGMLLFRDERGQLASVRESEVKRVEPVAPAPAGPAPEPAPEPAPPAAPRPAPAPAPGAPAIRYGNTDLTPLPEPPPEPEPAEVAPLPPEAPEAPAAPAESPPLLPAPPAEVGGKSEEWWRGEIGRLRGEIADLEQQEAVTYRLWVCAMHDIPLTGGECRPRVNELPPVNRAPRTPTQKSLSTQLSEVRTQLQAKRDELASFIDEAIGAGVPTGWLLAVLEQQGETPAEAEEQTGEGEPGN